MKLNEVGISSKKASLIQVLRRVYNREDAKGPEEHARMPQKPKPKLQAPGLGVPLESKRARQSSQCATPTRLTVLIATMEYDIEDWGIKVKIGGLGVMSSLMGKNLKHQNLIWVIPW